MARTLIVGYGNQYRMDDGVGFRVANEVLQLLGRKPLESGDDGFDDLGHDVDVVILHQIVPELAEMVAGYDQVIFVDAHVGVIPESIREERISASFRNPLVAHQFHPSTILALAEQMSGKAPIATLLSVLGHDFDFGEGLSPDTEALLPDVVARVTALLGEI